MRAEIIIIFSCRISRKHLECIKTIKCCYLYNIVIIEEVLGHILCNIVKHRSIHHIVTVYYDILVMLNIIGISEINIDCA